MINSALNAKKVPTYVRLQQMAYNEMGNQSGLLGMTATSRMLPATMRDVILSAATRVDHNNINPTGDQK